MPGDRNDSPTVSVIIPCFNEETTIEKVLTALLKQTFDLSQSEVVIADGRSTDRTVEVIQKFAKANPELTIRIVENPKRFIPTALNLAIAAARGEFIVRMDAHSVPNAQYVQLSVDAIQQGKGANVGGVWHIRPRADRWIPRSIAVAAGHPIGAGDAKYRFTDKAQSVDTVPYGAFRKALVDEIGGYDESLLANEDYEFNTRIRQNGHQIWLDPNINCIYFARPSLAALRKQYWRYGTWKAEMLRRYPQTLRWRQAIPPLFVLTLILTALLGIADPMYWWMGGTLAACYGLVLVIFASQATWRTKDWSLLIGFPLAIATMHFSWGLGLLVGLVRPPRVTPA